MKLENVQIEIKNKEHYEAVKKRLQELGRWNWLSENIDKEMVGHGYCVRLYIHKDLNNQWDRIRQQNHPSFPVLTLNDLYEVEKEKVIKERFRVYDATFDHVGTFDDREDAVKFIKEQKVGAYEIRPYYEVVEE